MSVAPIVDHADTIIAIEGLDKAFGTDILFKQAAFSVHRGETFGIIGESGSGKSVLLKMIIGLVDPDGGRILYKNTNVVDMAQTEIDQVHREIGYVFQSDALFDSMTVAENIGYGLREHANKSAAEIRARVCACLDMVGLAPRTIDLFPASLSGGMRKRVGVARAMAIEPEVLLYDEPTQGLDPQNITRIAQLIHTLGRKPDATAIVVTHDMRTAFGVCDRIALLHDNHFPLVATPRELLASDDPVITEFIDESRSEIEAVCQPAPISA